MNLRAMRPAFASLTVAALALALAPTAPAASTRNFDMAITGQTPPSAPVQGPFVDPYALALDGAGNIWVTDEERGRAVTGYDPMGGYFSQQNLTGYSLSPRTIAINRSGGEFFRIGSSEGQERIFVFNSSGDLLRQLTPSLFAGFAGGEFQLGVDNSGTASEGRLYITASSERNVNAYDPNTGNPVNFTESASYIAGNALTGTPAGPFGFIFNATVDSNGNIYVPDYGNHRVDEFEPSGKFVREFNGSEITEFDGDIWYVAIDPTNGHVLAENLGFESPSSVIYEFESDGKFIGKITGTSPSEPFGHHLTGIAVDSRGYLYVIDRGFGGGKHRVDVFLPAGAGSLPEAITEAAAAVERTAATLKGEADPAGGAKITGCQFEYVVDSEYEPWADHPYAHGGTGACLNESGETVGTVAKPIEAATKVHAPVSGLHSLTKYHFRMRLTNGVITSGFEVPRYSSDRTFETPTAVPNLQTGSASAITNTTATLNASFAGENLETHYYFEYGTTSAYGHVTSPGIDTGSGTRNLATPITGLSPGTVYHFRVIAENQYGTTVAASESVFITDRAPSIEGTSTSHVAATSAELEGSINPQGFATKYHFEYGPTTEYGASIPPPAEEEAFEITTGLSTVHTVKFEVTNLVPHTSYHFRLVAENQWGTTISEDQAFEFFPPSCPNSAVRQLTGSAYLPDCRAYELVSPRNGNATLLFPGGPNTGQATNPARFSFIGAFNMLEGANTVNMAGDLYVSTRTPTGWTTHYIGLSGDEAGCMGGEPSRTPAIKGNVQSPGMLDNTVLADPSMSHILNWNDGSGTTCYAGTGLFNDSSEKAAVPSIAPYLWSAEGKLEGRLPSNLDQVPGVVEALKCPYRGGEGNNPFCGGDAIASGDLSHVFFSSNRVSFAENEATHTPGLTEAPGSAYDDAVAPGTVKLISVLPNGSDIPQDPVFANTPRISLQNQSPIQGGEEEFIRFPGASVDGSRVLMSTATQGLTECPGAYAEPPCSRYTDMPLHLYMRVNDLVTYELAEGKAVTFVGMTPDASKVFFTSEEHLTGEDLQHGGSSLYMWSAAKAEAGDPQPVTLISKANPGSPANAGNTAECNASWTPKCGVLTFDGYSYSWLPGGRGGNGLSDSGIAAENGHIYFYSPEQLDGDKGKPGQENLYDYVGGERVNFVATFDPGPVCTKRFVSTKPEANQEAKICSNGPIVRLNVSPDDSHVALVTTTRLTSYDNVGYLEMYSYRPSAGVIVCDSCRPDGHPPTTDVEASQDGLFMTDDGRTFFSTTEALVPQDTDNTTDVYEFVGGRPQLITSGTGGGGSEGGGLTGVINPQVPGLIGVSATGSDVYFSTFDVLLTEDRNGNFLKFYDARTNGGFREPPFVAPCAAAEECHGPGTEAPELPAQGTVSTLSGGNVTKQKGHAHHKRHRGRGKPSHHRHHARRSANATGGGK